MFRWPGWVHRSGCAPSRLLGHLHGNARRGKSKSPGFLSNNKNISVLSAFFSYHIPYRIQTAALFEILRSELQRRGKKMSSIPAKTRRKLQRELGEIPAHPNPEAGLGCLALGFVPSMFPAEREAEGEAALQGRKSAFPAGRQGAGGAGFPAVFFLSLFSPWLCKSNTSCSFCPGRVSTPLAHHLVAACQGLVEQ